jgi:prevent-host-death family protein
MPQTLTITATEANRKFSSVLREVGLGKEVTITSHGRNVAVVSPAQNDDTERERRLAALAALKARWAKQPHITVGPWTREELYERERN